MCWFFIVIRLLMLKILLAGLTGLTRASHYDYGYHPSAEEFDNLLRETRRTWTHDLLKTQRDNELLKPSRTEARYFVPKYNYESEQKKFNQNPHKNPYNKRHDLQTSPSTANTIELTLQNVGSSLDFTYEIPKPFYNNDIKNNNAIKKQFIRQPTTATAITTVTDIKPVSSSALPETNLKPLGKPDILMTTNHKYSVNNLYTNNTQANFPIYFTNPATGIVYAITEVGKSEENVTKTNGSIPIFITKEQYERDIFQLKKEYENMCQMDHTKYPTTSFSWPTTTSTSTQQQIIRIQKPNSPSQSITSTNLSLPPFKRPSPVVVKTELVVKDKRPTRPLRKKKKKTKSKKKIKKAKPPGRKPIGTTMRPVLANQPQGPKIILGSRTTTQKPFLNNEKLSTQLEKPNFETTIFSSGRPLQDTATLNSNLYFSNYRRNKRSVNKSANLLRKNLLKIKTDNLLNHSINLSLKQTYSNNHNNKSANFNNKLLVTSTNSITGIDNFINSNNKILVNLNDKNSFKTKNENINKKSANNITKRKFIKKSTTFIAKNLLKNLSTKNLLGSTNNSITGQFFRNKTEKLNYSLISPRLNSTESNFTNRILSNSEDLTNNNLLKNKTNRIHKRSVNNDGPPKFFKKTTNSTAENMLKNSTDFITENLLSRSFKSTNINNNFPVTATKITNTNNRSFTKNPKVLNRTESNKRFSKNSKVKNSKKRILTNSKVNQTQVKSMEKFQNSRNRTKVLRKKKRLNKHNIKTDHVTNLEFNSKPSANAKNSSDINLTTPRTNKQRYKKLAYKIAYNREMKHSAEDGEKEKDTDYDFFDFVGDDDDESEEDDEEYDDEDDDDDEPESYEAIEENYENEEFDQQPQISNSEAGLSVEDLKEKITHENSSSAEDDADFGALEEEQFEYKNPGLDYDESYAKIKTKSTNSIKRIRRRPSQLNAEDDYEDDDDEENGVSSNLGGFFRMIFYPIQVVMGGVMDTFMSKDSEEEPINPYTQYTSYHNKLQQQSSDNYYDDDDDDTSESSTTSLSSWLSSWFGVNRRNKKIGSTTVAPVARKPIKSPSWLQSWFGIGANDRISTDTASTEDDDDDEYDKWFASWFGETKPKASKRTTTTSTTTQLPNLPILTIVDPMRNPQNWIGILAHHIINHTSTSTQNPLKDMWAKATSTTTENPEIPRKITYDKYQIWRLKPQDDTQVRALEEYKKSEDGIKLQWLKGPSLRGLTDVLVPPKMLVDFQSSLTFELIDHEVLIFDVGKAIAYEKSKEAYYFTTTQNPKKHHIKHSTPHAMTWHKYYEYEDIIQYLETMRMRFPQLVELLHIGRSYEGRPLIVMKIESKEAAAANSAHYSAHQKIKLKHKKRIGLANAVFIEAGTHGMEWIGPATATWIINELLKIMKKNSTDDQSFIRNTTWYIMPVLNPDGYVYSHEYDRFWKKSRSRHVTRPSGIINSAMTWLQKKRAKEKVCLGVDLDRNWHYQWGKRGSSKTPCNEFFAGPVAFSEPETKALSEFLMDYRTHIKLFISMQAYGQIISYPYKANTTYDSERLDDLLDVAMVGTDGLRKKGSKARYKIDSTNDLIENRSGCSDAFAAYEASIPFSYTLQLADNGVHGYLLPSASIESAAKDSFEIITGMLDYI